MVRTRAIAVTIHTRGEGAEQAHHPREGVRDQELNGAHDVDPYSM